MQRKKLDPAGDEKLRNSYHQKMLEMLNIAPKAIVDIGCATGLSTMGLYQVRMIRLSPTVSLSPSSRCYNEFRIRSLNFQDSNETILLHLGVSRCRSNCWSRPFSFFHLGRELRPAAEGYVKILTSDIHLNIPRWTSWVRLVTAWHHAAGTKCTNSICACNG